MFTERPKNLSLGCVAKDKISGFTGVVVAITEWLNGCQRATIQPKELKDGKPIDAHTFDAEQVEVVEPISNSKRKPHGGPSIPPMRKPDPR
jgi:hypothetical protein